MRSKKISVPIEIIPSHVHLSLKTWRVLFGSKKIPQILRPLSQRGQFVYQETVDLVGPKGTLSKIRILGDFRRQTQVEISEVEARAVGLKSVQRLSGHLLRTPGCKLIGPVGQVVIKSGVIIPVSHLHLNLKEAESFGFKQGQEISLNFWQDKISVLKTVVRVHSSFRTALHITSEVAAKLWLAPNEKAILVKDL